MVKITGYIWIKMYVDKIERKHGVSAKEVGEVIHNQPLFRRELRGRIKGEDVYSAAGQTDAGRYLMVYLIRKVDGRALPISARDMTHSERRRYGKA